MRNKILVFGKGFIGTRLIDALGCAASQRRITSMQDALEEIDSHKPRIIINCIGHTGKSNVDGCEQDKDATLFANTFVPVMLAEAALRSKVKFVHVSSGCIYHYDYGRDKPIPEEKAPDFFDLYYSRTKIYSERALTALVAQYGVLILRPRIPLDDRPHPRNILDKLIHFKQVIDAPNSITYLPDFIKALKHLISINASGIYNAVNKGALRYAELLDVYKSFVPGFEYRVIPYRKLKLVRTNLILSTRKLEKSGFRVRKIQEVLKECVHQYLKFS